MLNAKRVLLVVVVLTATIFTSSRITAAEYVIEIRQSKFVLDRIEAQPGDTITWINHDIVPHIATATDQSWDTGQINSGQAISIKLPNIFGRTYLCLYHPVMRGSL